MQRWLEGAFADSFAQTQGPAGTTEKEAPPLPLQSLLGLEQLVMKQGTPSWLVLLGGGPPHAVGHASGSGMRRDVTPTI